jgi:tetratricopeptide (TPR) repeat protein
MASKIKLLLPLLFSIILLLFSACNSGKKALERGNYEEAVLTAIDRLRQRPNSDKAREVLAKAYPRFVNYNRDRIRQLRHSGDPFRWERIMEYYREINAVYDEIQRAPAAVQVIGSPLLFTAEYEEARIEAAEARYALGKGLLPAARAGDRNAAKEAYDHFSTADELYGGFRDARGLALEARELALIQVVVSPIPMPARSLEISNEFFYNKIMEYLQGQRFSPFIEFYSLREAEAIALQADQQIEMAFDEFVVGQAFVKETVENRSRDSVVIGTVDVVEDGEKVKKDVYGTVKAEVHLFEKAIDSRGLLDLKVIGVPSDVVLAQEKFPGSFTWIDYWGFFNGDERALTGKDKRRLRNQREVMPPPPQDLFIEFTEPIYQDVTRFLRHFYSNY